MREVTRLAPGTQVVLRAGVRITVDREGPPRRPGFIGEVIQSVDTAQEETYIVRFSDGIVVPLLRRYLVVRRTLMTAELDMLAPDHINWLEFVFFRSTVGPHTYGIDDAEDEDSIRGIFLPPAELHWSLYKPQEQLERPRASGTGYTVEDVFWEIEKFLRLGLAGNHAVLETLWSPSVTLKNELGAELQGLKDAFLSKQIYNTFTGYAMSQFRKMQRANERGEEPRLRHAMEMVRVLLSGLHAAQTTELDITVQDHKTELAAIRDAKMPFPEVFAWAASIQKQFETAISRSPLPDLPDYESVNNFIVKARSKSVTVSAAVQSK